MTKKAIIVISLIAESHERSDREIAKEIFDELSRHPPKIPWMKSVVAVKVSQA